VRHSENDQDQEHDQDQETESSYGAKSTEFGLGEFSPPGRESRYERFDLNAGNLVSVNSLRPANKSNQALPQTGEFPRQLNVPLTAFSPV
jgi:hypothetical protein